MRRDTSGLWSVIGTQPGIPDDRIFVETFLPARSDVNWRCYQPVVCPKMRVKVIIMEANARELKN